MKHSIQGAILFFLLVFSSSASAREQFSITLQANESVPYWIEKPFYRGMGYEIIAAISKEMGITTQIEFRPLKRLIADTANNDLGNPLFYMNNQSFAAIIPIAVTYSAFFSYRPHTKACSLHPNANGCTPRRIGALKGTISDPSALATFGTFEESYSHESLFKKLKKGRITLALELDLVGNQSIRTLFPNEVDNFDVQIIPETASPIAIMIDSSTPNALMIGCRYQDGIHRIIQNGVYQKILQKYYGKAPIPSDWYSNLSNFEALYAITSSKGDQ
ncbi:MAG: transporter substrate-binding domain-containing protein [Campylobacterales bacterium]|nr:transporter substrate-binding domain-containing protein [Campylobacterales bacterium]